ncbi:hypothetical protein [Streptomyces sp. HNM0574]|uniref:hypothetical protein n=1 Tax=Streptomyces sp. HNM0574 TaxID=2714954 RepID=UPI00146E84BF|nr:hypothetical protein [Streptomyces sp. HNM0574]NLU69166.1 hypothetical protein [Streptomyces sp. HNM0574]
MRHRDAGFVGAAVVGWAAVCWLTVRLVARPLAPYPRWDLLVPLGLAAVAAGVWVWRAAAGRRRHVVPPADAGRTRGWWPARSTAWACGAMAVPLVPLWLLMQAAWNSSPWMESVQEGDPTVARATVRQVHGVEEKHGSKGSTYHLSEITAALPDDGTRATYRVTVRANDPLRKGGTVWALYDGQAPDGGARFGTGEGELRSFVGESAAPGQLALVVTAAVVSVVTVTGAIALTGPTGISESLRTAPRGVLRRRVRVLGAPGENATPGTLRLIAPEGGLVELTMDRGLDAHALSVTLDGRTGHLYWPRQADDEAPDRDVTAFLLLDGKRYLRGTAPASALTDGEEASDPFASPHGLRAVGPYVSWRWTDHRPALLGFATAGVCALLLATGAGSPAGYAEGTAGWLAAAGAFAAPAGVMTTHVRLGRRRTAGRSTT